MKKVISILDKILYPIFFIYILIWQYAYPEKQGFRYNIYRRSNKNTQIQLCVGSFLIIYCWLNMIHNFVNYKQGNYEYIILYAIMLIITYSVFYLILGIKLAKLYDAMKKADDNTEKYRYLFKSAPRHSFHDLYPKIKDRLPKTHTFLENYYITGILVCENPQNAYEEYEIPVLTKFMEIEDNDEIIAICRIVYHETIKDKNGINVPNSLTLIKYENFIPIYKPYIKEEFPRFKDIQIIKQSETIIWELLNKTSSKTN